MRALLHALAILAGTAPAWAQDCPSEQTIRDANRMAEKETGKRNTVIPMVSHSGRRYLVVKFPEGSGLVIAPNDKGCFDSMTLIPSGPLSEILKHTEAT